MTPPLVPLGLMAGMTVAIILAPTSCLVSVSTTTRLTNLLVKLHPRLLSHLGHYVKSFVGLLGENPSLACSSFVGKCLVLRLHAGNRAEVGFSMIEVGDKVLVGAGEVEILWT